jgi:uncharacterized protein involved in exopolysaccharide biosynthesis
MELQQKNEKSLHNRVNAYLRGKPATYAVEESEEATIEALFDQLQKAEEDLKTVQQRIDRLKWELAKAQS